MVKTAKVESNNIIFY